MLPDHARRAIPILTLIACLSLCAAAFAQEEADPAPAAGSDKRLLFEIGTWVSQPTGLELTAASLVDSGNPSSSTLIGHDRGTEDEVRYRGAVRLPNRLGSVGFRYYVHDQISDVRRSEPSNFIFGETLTFASLAGFGNDGLADGFISNSGTKLREYQIDYSRTAYRSDRFGADWTLGWRRVKYERTLDSTYYASLPGLPALLPPLVGCCPALEPIPDFAATRSSFEGRGPILGVDIDLPLWKDKLLFEGAVAMTVLRGDNTSEYLASNSYYTLDGAILGPPYDEFDDVDVSGPFPVPVADSIGQGQAGVSLRTTSSSQSGFVVDTELGFSWRFFDWLDLAFGIRSSRYDGVSMELSPVVEEIVPDVNGLIQPRILYFNEIERDVTYEGFYGNLRFSFL